MTHGVPLEGSTQDGAASGQCATARSEHFVLGRFSDPKSKQQIAAYKLYEMHASRWRNALNLERWNDACRERWELAQLSAARTVEP